MMSAKTVLTETPATSVVTAAPGNTGSAVVSGGAPSDFQNLLAGAVPPVIEAVLAAPAVPAASAAPPLVELLTLKNAQAAAWVAATPVVAVAPAAQPVVAATPVLPTDLLTLLPESPVEPVSAEETCTRDGDEPAVDDSDILAEWLDVMLPASVFAPQAGSVDPGTKKSGEPKDAALTVPLPVSLIQQAGLPDVQETTDTHEPVLHGANASIAIHRESVATAAQNAAAAFANVLGSRSEATEGEAPANDSWMSAMGDLTTRRSADLAPASELRLPTPVHDARWADALAHRLVLMAREGESVASLKLVPVDLGPLDIQISVRDGEASVHFGAAHAETRAVLESSMPRLRELLSAQGLQLSNATVSHQSGGQNRPERSTATGAVGAVTEETETASAQVVSTSLLDLYA
jgi:flagellar hook-length control protein FliK